MNINDAEGIIRTENESVLIAVPLQLYQQAIQNNTFLIDQNYVIKQLPDGSMILDGQVSEVDG